jgi:uncharacterized membrane protein
MILPPWTGLHPMLVHFPLVLLMVVPVFLALAIQRREPAGAYAISAWILLAMGALGAVAATMSGEAAESLVVATDQVREALERHSDLGEVARNIAVGLFLAQSAFLLWVRVFKKTVGGGAANLFLVLLFLGSIGGAVVVAMAGHAGAYLVHGLGVTNSASFLPPLPPGQ